jgi:MarR family transcriptional regulator, lower aerobic nicotinate degradation pathway regulator
VLNYKLLTEIIPYIETYQQLGMPDKIEYFFDWVNENKSFSKITETPKKSIQIPLQGGLEAKVCQLISLMYKYVRFYFKKGLNNSLLKTTEDFGFLATLIMLGDLKKNELIQKNTSEFTSGMEVIRRLERNKLISSFDDIEDKRAKRVKVTDLGHQVFIETLPVLKDIGTIAVGDLTETEKNKLLFLLNKLNLFHHPVFYNEKSSSLADIVEKYAEK